MFDKLYYFLRSLLNKIRKQKCPSHIVVKNHLPDNKKMYVKGTISFCHCRGHNCLVVKFFIDGFYETDRRLYWENCWFEE